MRIVWTKPRIGLAVAYIGAFIALLAGNQWVNFVWMSCCAGMQYMLWFQSDMYLALQDERDVLQERLNSAFDQIEYYKQILWGYDRRAR